MEHEDSCKSPGLNLGGDGGAKIFADGSYVDYGRENSTMTPKFLSINDWNARTTILGMAKTKGRKVVLCGGVWGDGIRSSLLYLLYLRCLLHIQVEVSTWQLDV